MTGFRKWLQEKIPEPRWYIRMLEITVVAGFVVNLLEVLSL